MSEVISVLVVEDEPLVRESLTLLIGLEARFRVVGAAGNGEDAKSMLKSVVPMVVLTDLDMPKLDGVELIRHIAQFYPNIKCVVLTKFGDDSRLFSALRSGAIGYLLKDAGIEEIRQAIEDASEGMGRLSPAIVSRVLAEFNRIQEQAKDTRVLFAELTRREVEVLELIGRGLRNRAIADELCLSEKTVKAHVGAILRKLQLLDRTEAALLAQKHGLGKGQ